MCLVAVAAGLHPRYRLVVAANRDEHHERATQGATWQPEGWLGGRDLKAGGTWFGVTRSGRYAFVTNVREPARYDPTAPSRGAFVPALLADPRPLAAALADLVATRHGYNGYNVVAGDRDGAWWASNRAPAGAPVALGRGIHGVSNAALDTPWPKVAHLRAALARWCADGDATLEPVFTALADRTLAPDAELPATGVPLDVERRISAAFIQSPTYGTRASTVYTVDHAGRAHFVEQAFGPDGVVGARSEFRFVLDAADQPLAAEPADG
ncbi:MAG: NRDE family protein [Proteobacteria bacterium]|nr:NRDE family protein [Pseudomonadota bacterium]